MPQRKSETPSTASTLLSCFVKEVGGATETLAVPCDLYGLFVAEPLQLNVRVDGYVIFFLEMTRTVFFLAVNFGIQLMYVTRIHKINRQNEGSQCEPRKAYLQLVCIFVFATSIFKELRNCTDFLDLLIRCPVKESDGYTRVGVGGCAAALAFWKPKSNSRQLITHRVAPSSATAEDRLFKLARLYRCEQKDHIWSMTYLWKMVCIVFVALPRIVLCLLLLKVASGFIARSNEESMVIDTVAALFISDIGTFMFHAFTTNSVKNNLRRMPAVEFTSTNCARLLSFFLVNFVLPVGISGKGVCLRSDINCAGVVAASGSLRPLTLRRWTGTETSMDLYFACKLQAWALRTACVAVGVVTLLSQAAFVVPKPTISDAQSRTLAGSGYASLRGSRGLVLRTPLKAEEAAEPAGEAKKKVDWVLLAYFAMWYLGNYYYNITNKLALKAAGGAKGFPMTIATLQLGVGCLWALLLWGYPDTRKLPEITAEDYTKTLLVGLTSAGAHAASVFALSAGAVSFGQIVKAAEPAFAALIGTLFYSSKVSVGKWLCLIPVIGGVVLASLAELDFAWAALITAAMANVFAAFKGNENKKLMGTPGLKDRMGGVGNQFAITMINSFIFCVILCAITEGRKFGTFLKLASSNNVVLLNLIYSGLWFYAYNELATFTIKKTNAVTSSVANTAKRVIVIVGVALVMHESLSPLKLIGCTIGIGGVFLYSVIDDLLKK
ncbi:PPT2 [Symbiodinium natans]|uniref:PPT2 protein n=1 Tax=Symbiodinium natans TaxID=878477 RepID=A0A812PK62_9DINO|nr:PPT2 [Symbiodinium natans]